VKCSNRSRGLKFYGTRFLLITVSTLSPLCSVVECTYVLLYCGRVWMIQKEVLVGLVQLDNSEQQQSSWVLHTACLCLMVVQLELYRTVFIRVVFIVKPAELFDSSTVTSFFSCDTQLNGALVSRRVLWSRVLFSMFLNLTLTA